MLRALSRASGSDCCNRLEEPSSGAVVFDGTDITQPGVELNRVRQKIGMVFQSFNLYPHMDALGNARARYDRNPGEGS